MADLLTLTELRTFLGVDSTDHRDDTMYAAMIPAASVAIRNFTERDFGAPSVTEERAYEYDGSGYIDIDDATAITRVAFSVPSGADIELPTDSWRAMPVLRDDAPVFYYLLIAGGYSGLSTEMGFLRNLDVLAAEGRLPQVTPLAKVTGTFGWPAVPEDVKLAALWTIQEWTSKDSGESLSAESIEGFSRSWGSKTGGTTSLAIPNRARDILANYQKQLS